MKIIEVITHHDHIKSVEDIGHKYGAIDQWYVGSADKDERRIMRLLVDDPHRQAIMDAHAKHAWHQ